MQAFAKLLDSMSTSSSTLAKRRLMAEYFRATPDPERGWALAALAGTLSFPKAKPNVIRLLPSLALRKKDANEFLEAIQEEIHEMEGVKVN